MSTKYNHLNFTYRWLGGSHLYGLNTSQSDEDDRGIYVYNTLSEIMGLECHKEGSISSPDGSEEDYSYKEMRHFFHLLKKSANTECVELLFADRKNFSQVDPFLEQILAVRPQDFFSSDQLFITLRGYLKGERMLANGERTGKLGGKRKAALEEHGFSPKNFVQAIRLATVGIEFFKSGNFHVNIPQLDMGLADELIDIKLNPTNWKKEELDNRVGMLDGELEKAYNSTKVKTQFNEELVNAMLAHRYGEEIAKNVQQRVDGGDAS